MRYYDNRQFNAMRNDAIRRSREMYQNSMVNTSHYSQADNYKKKQEEPKIDKIEQVNNIKSVNNKPMLPENISKIFDGKLDTEKLTIIALMIILAKDGADMKLILALGYILM